MIYVGVFFVGLCALAGWLLGGEAAKEARARRGPVSGDPSTDVWWQPL